MRDNLIKIIAWYSIILGISVVVLWVLILGYGQVREESTEMSFHIISELIMAGLCVAGGISLVKNGRRKSSVAAHAMVVYSVLNAAGYYAGQNDLPTVLSFMFIFLLSVAALIALLFLSEHQEPADGEV